MAKSFMICEIVWEKDKRQLQTREFPFYLVPIKIVEAALYAVVLHFSIIYFQTERNPFYFVTLLFFGFGFVSYMSYLIKEQYVRTVHGHVLYQGVLSKYLVNIIISWSSFGSVFYFLITPDKTNQFKFLLVGGMILVAFFQYILKSRKIRKKLHLI